MRKNQGTSRRTAAWLLGALALLPSVAVAQSTAQPTTPGYLSTSGCPASYTSCFVPYGASGQTVTAKPTNSAAAYSAATVGTTDSTIVAASTATVFLDATNNSSAAYVCINVGATATINAAPPYCPAGEIMLTPNGGNKSWDGTYVPSDAIHAIATAASTPVTVGAK